MPIHDWTRVDADYFHQFHQGWTIDIRRVLSRGLLPPTYHALIDLPMSGPPDETDEAYYARKANRIIIRQGLGDIVSVLAVVAPGNKESERSITSFVTQAVNYIRHGIHLVVIDLFPPSPRDPEGFHHRIWDELIGDPFEARPLDKPLMVASYEAGEEVTAYVDPVAVGDTLPDVPLFLAPGRCVSIPLEQIYQASWQEVPEFIRDLVSPPRPETP